jgi:hypothetical protein
LAPLRSKDSIPQSPAVAAHDRGAATHRSLGEHQALGLRSSARAPSRGTPRPGARHRRRATLSADRAPVPAHQDPKSTEHGQLTPVFGTACPPTGLSGRLRDFGHQFSEGRLSRWLSLLVADRVNMIEDLFSDIAQGCLPNLAKEMGLRSELKYNAAGLARKAIVAGLCLAGAMAYLRMRHNR